MKRTRALSFAVLLVVTTVWMALFALIPQDVWSQVRRPANDPPRGRPGATRPGTTPQRAPAAVTARPTQVQPTQETCNCVTFASIEIPTPVGTLARHVAMGGGGYGMSGDIRTYAANPYLIDTYSYTINPAYAERFRESVFANIGAVAPTVPGGISTPINSFGGQSFGAIFSISPRVTIGGIAALENNPGITPLNTDIATALATFGLNRFPGWTGQFVPPGLVPGNIVPNFRSRSAFYLSTSYNTGGVVIGAGASYTSSVFSPVVTNPPQPFGQPAFNLTQLGFNAGVLITTATSSALDLSGSLLLPRLSSPVSNSTTATEVLSATVLGLNARYIARISKAFWIIPMANFYSISSPATGNITAIDGGIGMNYLIGPLLFVGGIGVSQTTGGNLATVSPSSLEFIFPRFNLGVEYAATNWLRLRGGYAHTTANRRINATSGSPEVNLTTINNYSLINGSITLGFGLQFGGFIFDLTTDTESIRRGFGGIGTTPSFGYVSAVFRF
jgi:hypothetical protein